MKLTPEQFVVLESAYLRHFPSHIPSEIFKDYKTILEYKDIISGTIPDKRILNHLLDTVIDKIESNQRFQKTTFIKLIRYQCRDTIIDSTTSDKLFFVFKSLINGVSDAIAWSLSVTIKDIELSQDNIDWLVENYEISEHLQNRLLRYPKPNKAITTWAKQRMKKKDLDNRVSELIGVRLNFDPDFTYKDRISLIWGVHYSKLVDKRKKELLLRHLTADNLKEFIKICERNNFTDIISRLYNDVDIERN